LAGTHTGHTDRGRTSQLNRDSIRLSAAGPSCVGCARHGHRGRAAAAGVSVGFRSRVRGSGPRAGLGFGAGRGPGDWVQLKYLGTRGSPRWIILRKHPRVRGLPLPEPDTLWLVHTQKLSKNKTRTGPTIPQRRTATHHAQTESCALAGARLLSGRLAAGEHVPNPPEQNFVRNIHVHNCRGIVLCWGSVGALLSA
jgi:hypothetical protein